MSHRLIHKLCAATGFTIGAFFLVGGASTAKDPLPADVTTQLIASDIEFLNKGLAKTPEKRAVGTLKATAMMLAMYGQNNLDGPKGTDMGALRAQALKVAEAVAKKEFAVAKTAAGGLKDAKGGDTKEMPLHTMAKLDISEVMSVFRKSTVGGRNIENDIKDMSTKGVTDVALAGAVGGRSAVLAQFTAKMTPTGSTPAKAKQWADFATEMQASAVAVAEEAAKGMGADKKKLTDLVKKQNKNCVDCHNVFKVD